MKPKTAIVVSLIVAAASIGGITYFSIKLRKVRKERNIESKKNVNVRAFLALIRYAEGTDRKSNPYAVTFGYSHTITNFSDHPAVTGEWTGKTLSDSMCKGAGLKPGCKSTAAGAYQFIRATWTSLKKSLDLPDFSGNSQDLAAIELIKNAGALEDLEAGRVEVAINKCRKIWASLPGAGYSQPEKSLAVLLDKFVEFKELYA